MILFTQLKNFDPCGQKSFQLVSFSYVAFWLVLLLSIHQMAYVRKPAFWFTPAFKRRKIFTAKWRRAFTARFCTYLGIRN